MDNTQLEAAPQHNGLYFRVPRTTRPQSVAAAIAKTNLATSGRDRSIRPLKAHTLRGKQNCYFVTVENLDGVTANDFRVLAERLAKNLKLTCKIVAPSTFA